MGEPTPEAKRHPDGELLDAYADGERTPGSVDRHVRGCTACQRTVVGLRDMRVELARLAPISMPPEVARRIHDALTATPPPAPPASGAGRDARRSAAGRRRRSVGRSAAALRPAQRDVVLPRSSRSERLVLLAVCLLVVVTGGGLIVALQHRDSATGTSSDAAGSAAISVRADSAKSGPGATAPRAESAAAAPGDLAGLASAAPVQAVRVATSLDVLEPAAVARHAQDLLAGRVPAAANVPLLNGPLASATESWARLATPALLACYEKLTDLAHGPLLAVDEVTYRGRVAVLAVLDLPDAPNAGGGGSTAAGAPAPSDGGAAAGPIPAGRDLVQLIVVDLGCSADQLTAATLFEEKSTKAA